MILARLRPTVDQAAFASATCHRCGTCCERFWLPSALDVSHDLTRRTLWALHDCDVGLPVYHLAALGGRRPYPALILDAPGLLPPRRPCAAEERQWHADERAFAGWLLEIEPNLDGPGDRRTYRCPRYGVAADGQPGCTRYEERPNTCSKFPYGRPDTSFVGCAFDVQVFDPEPLLGLEAA